MGPSSSNLVISFSIFLALESNSISNPVSNSILNSASNSVSNFISNSVSSSLKSKSILSSKRIYISRLVSIFKSRL